jgi:hypothetical protein
LRRQIAFRSLRESIDTTTPAGRLQLHLFGAVAEFEREVIRERTRAGLEAAALAAATAGAPPRSPPTSSGSEEQRNESAVTVIVSEAAGRLMSGSCGLFSGWRRADSQSPLLTGDPVNSQALERVGYDTQKPAALLERIIEASSSEGDLVMDAFCGSGTTLVIAEKLGRRWIGVDLGRFAVHTTRKRLLDVPDCNPFEIKDLGAYERQRWQAATGNGALRAYLDTILAFYRAEPVDGFIHLHGRKASRMVHVGATDAPVTIDETEEVMDEMADNGIEACDLLGWEWEMGLHDTITERARRRGLDLRPRQPGADAGQDGEGWPDAQAFWGGP